MAVAGRVAIVPKGEWNAQTAYKRLDAVTHNNTLYFARKDVPAGTATTNTEYWMKSIGILQSIPIATEDANGLMSKEDKKKLDGLKKYTPDGTTITADEDGTLHGASQVEIATTSKVGTVKPDGKTITVDADGTIHGANTYTLPKASTSVLGGIIADGETVQTNEEGVLSVVSGGSGGIAPSNMLAFSATAGNGEVKLYIKEPADTVIDNQLLCTIAGVKIVRKDTGYPNTEKAGIEVLDIKREDFGKYATTPYKDQGLTNGKTYYYAAFPYSDYNVVNRNPANRASAEPKKYQLYGFDVDQNDSNPKTRVSYPSDVDNAGWSPMTVNQSTGAYDLGQWANAFFITGTRPVMLKYDGTVDYELDHDDQTKKKGGGTSDISNTSYAGNAMVEFPKMYFKRWEADGIQHVRVSDQQIDSSYKCYQHMYDGHELDTIYLPMFEGSSVSSKVRSIAGQTPMNSQTGATEKTQIEANGAGWQFDDWIDKQMITHLLFLIGKSTDLQATFGNGHYTGGSQASNLLATGTLKNKGMFYGTSGNVAVKFFWLENYYGDRWDRTYGVVYTTSGKIMTKPYPPYNIDGTGYTNTGITITGTSGGYIKKTKMTEYGEFPIDISGSETTYQPDGGWFSTAQLNFLLWGADCSDGLRVGAAFSVYSPFSDSAWVVGPALAYKKPLTA